MHKHACHPLGLPRDKDQHGRPQRGPEVLRNPPERRSYGAGLGVAALSGRHHRAECESGHTGPRRARYGGTAWACPSAGHTGHGARHGARLHVWPPHFGCQRHPSRWGNQKCEQTNHSRLRTTAIKRKGPDTGLAWPLVLVTKERWIWQPPRRHNERGLERWDVTTVRGACDKLPGSTKLPPAATAGPKAPKG